MEMVALKVSENNSKGMIEEQFFKSNEICILLLTVPFNIDSTI